MNWDEVNFYLLSCSFHKSPSEATLYIKFKNDESLIVFIYVDDIICTGNYAKLIKEFKNDMMSKYEMTNLGFINFLGWE